MKKNNLKELINLIIKKYPKIRDFILNKEGNKIKKSISIVINDSIVPNKDGLDMILKNHDKIAFLLPFSGG